MCVSRSTKCPRALWGTYRSKKLGMVKNMAAGCPSYIQQQRDGVVGGRPGPNGCLFLLIGLNNVLEEIVMDGGEEDDARSVKLFANFIQNWL